MVNMPDSVVSTKEDYPTHIAFQLPERYKHKEWHHVGTVGEHTQGLILLTDDRTFAKKLNSSRLPEKYFAIVNGQVTQEDAQHFQRGVEVENATVSADMKILQAGQQESKVEIHISNGGAQDLYRMFAQISKPARELIRIGLGPVELEGSLLPSEVRALSTEEVQKLSKYLH
jgi:16S rRNA pseudouridine516 synthase